MSASYKPTSTGGVYHSNLSEIADPMNEESIDPIPLLGLPAASASQVLPLLPSAMAQSMSPLPRASHPIRHPQMFYRQIRQLNEREHFFLFIRILLRSIQQAEDGWLHQRAKWIVAECTRRNRIGDLQYVPLQPVLHRQLRCIVGELHWNRAKRCLARYCRQKGLYLRPTTQGNGINDGGTSAFSASFYDTTSWNSSQAFPV